MGVLIVVGIGVLGYGLYKKSAGLSGGGGTPAPASTPAPSAPVAGGAPGQIAMGRVGSGGAVAPFDILSLGEPKGTVAREFRISGSTLVIELAGGGKPPRLVAVDLSRGAVLGTILLNDAP
jgi:hypothetical protein